MAKQKYCIYYLHSEHQYLRKQPPVVNFREKSVFCKVFVFLHPALQNFREFVLFLEIVHAWQEHDGHVEGGEAGEDVLGLRNLWTGLLLLQHELLPEVD